MPAPTVPCSVSARSDHEPITPYRRAWCAITFLILGGLILAYSLPGGAYDIVTRQRLAIAAWSLLAAGVLSGVLPRGRFSRSALLPLAALLGYGAWTALSLLWTSSSERTTAELARVVGYLGLALLVAALIERRTWRAAAGGVTVAALLICCLALTSRLRPGWFPAGAPLTDFVAPARLSYPLGYWNALAAWGAMSIALALAWSAHARTLIVRCLSLAGIPVAGTVIYLTFSRQGIAGVALAVVAVVALARNRWATALHAVVATGGSALAIAAVRAEPAIEKARGSAGTGHVLGMLALGGAICAVVPAVTSLSGGDRLRLSPRVARRSVAVAGAVLLVIAASVGPGLAARGWDQFSANTQGSLTADPASRLSTLQSARREVWGSALEAFGHNRFQGLGAGTFEFWWATAGRSTEFVRNAHSLYLENLAELGIFGFALVVTALLAAWVAAFRTRRRRKRTSSLGASAGLIACFTVYLLHAGIDWMWQLTAVTALALVSVVIACGGSRRQPVRYSTGVRAATVAAAALAVAVELPGLSATVRQRASEASVRAGDLNGALREATRAVAAEPWAATPYAQRALVAERAGQLLVAGQDIGHAMTREPNDWRWPYLAARIDAEQGQVRAARDALAQAQRLHHGLGPLPAPARHLNAPTA